MDDDRGSARRDAIDRLVAEGVGEGVLSAGDMCRRPAVEGPQDPAGLFPEWDQLRVLDAPAAGQLLDDQLGVQEQVDLARAELPRETQRTDDRRVLGDIVRLDAEELGDGGVRSCARIAGVGARGVDERGSGRRRSGIAARGPVGPDDQATRASGGLLGLLGLVGCPERPFAVTIEGAQPGSPPGSGDAPDPRSAGKVGPGVSSSSRPRSLRQTIWIGS